MRYYDKKLFWLLDVLVFCAAALAGWYLLARRKLSAPAVCLAMLLPPLCLSWFLSRAAAEPFNWWFYAALLVTAASMLLWTSRRLADWRHARVALAPDPYLEEAEGEKGRKGEGETAEGEKGRKGEGEKGETEEGEKGRKGEGEKGSDE